MSAVANYRNKIRLLKERGRQLQETADRMEINLIRQRGLSQMLEGKVGELEKRVKELSAISAPD